MNLFFNLALFDYLQIPSIIGASSSVQLVGVSNAIGEPLAVSYVPGPKRSSKIKPLSRYLKLVF